jgi:hypothetical protein
MKLTDIDSDTLGIPDANNVQDARVRVLPYGEGPRVSRSIRAYRGIEVSGSRVTGRAGTGVCRLSRPTLRRGSMPSSQRSRARMVVRPRMGMRMRRARVKVGTGTGTKRG